ncbi:MAG: hypothetical protein WB820_14650 [Rhodoplanes sp.]
MASTRAAPTADSGLAYYLKEIRRFRCWSRYADPLRPDQGVHQTFCGT